MNVKTTVSKADIKVWDWAASVEKVRGLYVGNWKKTSKELIETLYQAKQQINQGVGNPHGRYTWKQYCLDAFNGAPTSRTCDNWIRRYEIGEEAWLAEQQKKKALKLETTPSPIDDDTLFIQKKIKNKDGSYTVRLSVSEYPDILFEETITV